MNDDLKQMQLHYSAFIVPRSSFIISHDPPRFLPTTGIFQTKRRRYIWSAGGDVFRRQLTADAAGTAGV
jgi:hypothetical protein